MSRLRKVDLSHQCGKQKDKHEDNNQESNGPYFLCISQVMKARHNAAVSTSTWKGSRPLPKHKTHCKIIIKPKCSL